MESYPHLSGLEIPTKKIWVNHQFLAIEPWIVWPQIQKLSPKNLQNTSYRVNEPNLNESRHLPSSSEKKKKKICKTPCFARVENLFPTDPTTTTPPFTPTPSLHRPPWKNASASSTGWGYSIHSSASKREKYWWPQPCLKVGWRRFCTAWHKESVKDYDKPPTLW